MCLYYVQNLSISPFASLFTRTSVHSLRDIVKSKMYKFKKFMAKKFHRIDITLLFDT